MKDPLLKYIEENRGALDTHTPSAKNWEQIESKITKKKTIKKRLLYASSIAAIAILGLFVINQNSFDDSAELVMETTIEDSLSDMSIERTTDVNWEMTQSIEAGNVSLENRKPSNGFGDNYLWSINTEVPFLSFSSDNTQGTYTLDVSDNSGCNTNQNGSPMLNGNVFLPFSDSTIAVNPSVDRYYAIDQNKAPTIRYDVDRYYEQYEDFKENQFETPLDQPLSTFGIDVDGAAYSNMRRFIESGYLPPKNAVKLEEMMNYFNYDLPEPEGDVPFSITTELAECPWKKEDLLLQVALKGEAIEMGKNQTNNLVFLIDVSGSMNHQDKLPLLKKSLYLLVNEMGTDDRIAIVVYAGASGLTLPSTPGTNKSAVYDAIENLNAGGSTAGGAGIELAYKVATESFIKDGNNRVILATDGDFNVGVSDDDALVKLIEQKRETGVSLSVLGFGTGNLQSSKMEKLADNGNGNYYYIDNILEAKKVLVDQIGGTLITIAKDVKLQLEFNPEHVKNYRLLGYENRILAAQDFADDRKDAGDLGSGHTIVALYQIVPSDSLKVQEVSGLRYQKKLVNPSKGLKEELAVIKFRYKKPNSSKSTLIERIVKNERLEKPSENLLFASAVAEFGMLIRESGYRGGASFEQVIKRACANKGQDEFGYRAEFIQLVERAQLLIKEYKLKLVSKN